MTIDEKDLTDCAIDNKRKNEELLVQTRAVLRDSVASENLHKSLI